MKDVLSELNKLTPSETVALIDRIIDANRKDDLAEILGVHPDQLNDIETEIGESQRYADDTLNFLI